jgi:FMN-dependent dehydrogenase
MAYGARAVLVGRPILWGLAVDREAGVKAVLEMLLQEFDLAMALSGYPSLAAITKLSRREIHESARCADPWQYWHRMLPPVEANGQERRSGNTWRTIKDMFSQLFNDLCQQRVIPMFAG